MANKSKNNDIPQIHRVCTVMVGGYEDRPYEYIPLEDTKAGDYVIVPFGWENWERVAFVQKVEYKPSFDLWLPFDCMKTVIKPFDAEKTKAEINEGKSNNETHNKEFLLQWKKLAKKKYPVLAPEDSAFAEGDWIYRNEKDGVQIIKYAGKDKKKIVIPEKLGGREVTRLGKNLFWFISRPNPKVEEVIIPKTVRVIGERAFSLCGYIRKIEIPKGTVEIENSVFHLCGGLVFLDVPDTVKKIGPFLFSSEDEPEEVALDEKLVVIVDKGSYAEQFFREYKIRSRYIKHKSLNVQLRDEVDKDFYIDYDELFEYDVLEDGTIQILAIKTGGDVVIPEQIQGCPVTVIPGFYEGTLHAAEENTVTSLTLPKSAVKLNGVEDSEIYREKLIFDNFFHLESLTVPKENPYYYTDGYALFSKDKKCLIKFYRIGATQYSVPKGTVRICNGAFARTDIEEVNLPDSVKEIGYCAFGFCPNFRTLTGGKNVKSAMENFAIETPFAGSETLVIGKTLVHHTKDEKLFRVPDGVEVISAEAFKCCKSMEELILPPTVRVVEEGVLSGGLTNLRRITLEDGNGSLLLMDGILYTKDLCEIIGMPYAYQSGDGDFTITVPSAAKKINMKALHNRYVTRIEFQGEIEDFAEKSIYQCECLKEVVFCDEQTELVTGGRYGIIYGCKQISHIHLPAKLEVLGANFCTEGAIQRITAANTPAKIIEARLNEKYEASLPTVLPETLREIGDGAFANQPAEYVSFPKNVKRIGQGVIGRNLKRITVYDSVQKNPAYKNRSREDVTVYVHQCICAIPFIGAGPNQMKPYEIVVLSATDDSEKFRLLMPPVANRCDCEYFSKAWKKNNDFSFKEADSYFPELEDGAVHYAILRLIGDDHIQSNKEMMIRTVLMNPEKMEEICREFLQPQECEKLIKSLPGDFPDTSGQRIPEGYRLAEASVFAAKKVCELDEQNSAVQGFFRGIKADVELMQGFFRDSKGDIRILKEYDNGIVEGRVDVNIVKTAISLFRTIKFTGLTETSRGIVNAFYSGSGYPYITDFCQVGSYDRKADWNWDWDCDMFAEFTKKITYIQTGDREIIRYKYPFANLWNDDVYYHEENGVLYEPVKE